MCVRLNRLCLYAALLLAAGVSRAQIIINEADVNQPGADAAEFIELYNLGGDAASLDDLTLVLYNGTSNSVYAAFDLSGFSTRSDGYFVLGNAALAPDIALPSDALRNGVDAIALYIAPASRFPEGEFITTDGLVDALVYATGQGESLALLSLQNPGQEQVDEDSLGTSDAVSMQRCPDGSGGARNTLTYKLSNPSPGAPNDCASLLDIRINEVDCDQAGAPDAAEFIELYDGGTGNTPLDHYVVVLYNGGDDSVYAAYDLDGEKTDPTGYFLLGAAGLTPEVVLPSGMIQDGADAIALYIGDAEDFLIGSGVAMNGIVDAIVYGTGNATDNGLLPVLNDGEPQVNENAESTKDLDSMQRCPNGGGDKRSTSGYVVAEPTPRSANECPASAPVAAFTWSPQPVYAGEPTNFVDRSTGPPTGWQWTFNGSEAGISFVQNPTGIVFGMDAIGSQIVQLSVSNPQGTDTAFTVIQVLDPAPTAAGIIVAPQSATICQNLSFIAYGVLGRGEIEIVWNMLNTAGTSVFQANGNPLRFAISGAIAPGAYRARLRIFSDSFGSFETFSPFFNVKAATAPTLTLTTPVQATNLPSVQISVEASTELAWLELTGFTVSNGTLQELFGWGDAFTFRVVPTAEGPVTVQANTGAGVDTCDLETQASNVIAFQYDVTPPAPILAREVPGPATTAPIAFVLSSTEPLSTPEIADFTVENGSVAEILVDGFNYLINVTPVASGTVTVNVASGVLFDLAGNPYLAPLSALVEYAPITSPYHTTDRDQDNIISIDELLRVIQFYNSLGLHCEVGTEDNYAVGMGDTNCTPHEADYAPQDWFISLDELLRIIQFYNSLGYYRCGGDTEDGFCAGRRPRGKRRRTCAFLAVASRCAALPAA
jgi:PKD repeat protein